MNAALAGEKRRLVLAGAGAVVIVAAFLFLVRVPPGETLPSGAVPGAPRSAVHLAKPSSADGILSEIMELRDMRPLFLPTDRNATLPEPKVEPGRTFFDISRFKLSFPETDLHLDKDLPPVVTLNGKSPEEARPADALAPDWEGPSLLGFGRNPVPAVLERPLRGGFVEVVSTQTGERLWGLALGSEARPPGNTAWAPMEFMAAVDAAGLAAPLVLAQSSRVEEVDAHFRTYLVRTLRIGERLTPGFYRIVVAP